MESCSMGASIQQGDKNENGRVASLVCVPNHYDILVV